MEKIRVSFRVRCDNYIIYTYNPNPNPNPGGLTYIYAISGGLYIRYA